MTNTEIELLLHIFRETRRVEGLSPRRDYLRDDPREWVERSLALQDLKAGLGVRVHGGWLGTDSASRQARSRGLKSLAARGFVALSGTWGDKTTHVRLTPAGRAAAEGLNHAE